MLLKPALNTVRLLPDLDTVCATSAVLHDCCEVDQSTVTQVAKLPKFVLQCCAWGATEQCTWDGAVQYSFAIKRWQAA